MPDKNTAKDAGFLPTGYKVPSTSNYMKWQKGENRFRILSNAIVGYEYWNKDKKPVRSREPLTETPADMGFNKEGQPNPIKAFWAFVVWNYGEERIQILEITQSTVMTPMQSYVQNKKWGNPNGYDFIVKKEGDTMQDTVYTVTVDPHSALEKAVADEWARRRNSINLEAMFKGEDPFATSSQKVAGADSIAYPTNENAVNGEDVDF